MQWSRGYHALITWLIMHWYRDWAWTDHILQCYCCAVLSCSVTSLWPHGLAHQAPLSMEILQARILEWVAMPSSRSCSQPRDRTQVSHIAGEFFTIWILVNFKYIYSQSHVVMCFPHPVYSSFLSPWCALDHLFAQKCFLFKETYKKDFGVVKRLSN